MVTGESEGTLSHLFKPHFLELAEFAVTHLCWNHSTDLITVYSASSSLQQSTYLDSIVG